MADDDKKDPPKPDPKDDLGDAGKRALDAERQARRDAEKALKDAQDRLKALEDKDKSETQKALDDKAAAERDRDTAKANMLRLEVAMAKGLTAAQAKRLVGTTKEELESDADDILATFKPADSGGGDGGDGKGAPRKPAEDLKGGGDPTKDTGGETERIDPAKLAESVPRY